MLLSSHSNPNMSETKPATPPTASEAKVAEAKAVETATPAPPKQGAWPPNISTRPVDVSSPRGQMMTKVGIRKVVYSHLEERRAFLYSAYNDVDTVGRRLVAMAGSWSSVVDEYVKAINAVAVRWLGELETRECTSHGAEMQQYFQEIGNIPCPTFDEQAEDVTPAQLDAVCGTVTAGMISSEKKMWERICARACLRALREQSATATELETATAALQRLL